MKALQIKRDNAATIEQVGLAIGLCESLSQVKPLTDPQRKALQRELFKLGWTNDELEKRARSVALNSDREYGNIGLRYWIDKNVKSTDEVEFLAAMKMRRMLSEGLVRIKHPDAKEVSQSALSRLEFEYEQEFREMLEAEVERQREAHNQIVKEWSEKIAVMKPKEKKKLFAKGVEAGIWKNDKNGDPDTFILANMHMRQIIQKMIPIL